MFRHYAEDVDSLGDYDVVPDSQVKNLMVSIPSMHDAKEEDVLGKAGGEEDGMRQSLPMQFLYDDDQSETSWVHTGIT